MPQDKKKDSFKPDRDSFVKDSFAADKPQRVEELSQYGQRGDIFNRELTKRFPGLIQPGQQLQRGVSQLGNNTLAGIFNILGAGAGATSLPFSAAESTVRQIPVVGEPMAEAATLPFKLAARGVQMGERTIESILPESLRGINPEAAEAMSGVNQFLAQVLVGGGLGKLTPKAPKPVALERFRPTRRTNVDRPTETIAAQSATKIPPSFRAKMINELGGREIQTRFGKLGQVSDTDLTRLYQEAGLDKPAPLSEAPVSRGGSMDVRGPANVAQIKKVEQGKASLDALSPELSQPIKAEAQNLFNELQSAFRESFSPIRRAGKEEPFQGGEVVGYMKGGGVSTFPDWFKKLGKDKKTVLENLQKIIVNDPKNAVAQELKSIIDEHLTQGRQTDMGFIPPDPKYVETKAGQQGVLLSQQAQYPRPEQGIRSTISPQKQIEGTMFEKPKPEEPSLFGGEPPKPPTKIDTPEATGGFSGDPVAKITQLIKEAKPVRKETELLYSQERRKRSGQISQIFQQPQGEQTAYAALGALKGELPKAQFEPVRPKLTQGDVDALFNKITTHSELRPFEKITAQGALLNLLQKEGGRVPNRSELYQLERVFGGEFADAVLSQRNWKAKLKEGLLDVINLPRALVTSFDMSAPLRQGLVLTISHPARSIPAWGDMVKAFASEDAFKAVRADIHARKNFPLYEDSGLYLAEAGSRALELTKREESFMSRFAEKVPVISRGVKASQRAYVTYLNKLRVDTFDHLDTEFRKLGFNPEKNPDVYDGLSKYINLATGRGNLGKYGERIAPFLNGVFFSPRFMTSRFQLLNPVTYAKLPKPVRVEAMKNMAILAGAGTTLLTLAKMGGADVEIDPRSSDFAKIKIGNTRLDIWGGFQQWIRFFAQQISGERKSTTTGEIKAFDAARFPGESRLSNIYRFGEQKLAPSTSLLADWLRGTDMIGGDITLEKEATQKLIPMYLQDANEAIKELGLGGAAAVTVPGFFGTGVQTYKPRPKKLSAPVGR